MVIYLIIANIDTGDYKNVRHKILFALLAALLAKYLHLCRCDEKDVNEIM